MKKMKILPLLGVALLALTGCNKGGGEVTRGQAKKQYQDTNPAEYHLANFDHWNSIDEGAAGDPEQLHYPEVVNGRLKAGTSITDVSGALVTLDMYGYLYYFHENQGLDNNDVYFNNADELTFKLAKFFQEDGATYTLDGKLVKSYFTGSKEVEVSGVKYGLAMYYEVNYDKHGFITEASFSLAVTADYNAKKGYAETVLMYRGLLTCEVVPA